MSSAFAQHSMVDFSETSSDGWFISYSGLSGPDCQLVFDEGRRRQLRSVT